MRTIVGALQGFTVVAVVALSAALLFSFLAPLLALADSVAHFRLHLLAALALVGVALLILRRFRAALGAAAIIVGVAAIGLRPAVLSGEAAATEPADLTLLQLNLLYKNRDHAAVLRLIAREKPDLIAFQEVSTTNRPLLAALKGDYPLQSICPFAGVGSVAVLSRFPRAASFSTPGGVQGCFVGRGLTWVRVETPNGPLTVASLHLHWPYPYGQRPQVDDVAASLRGVARPILIGGDFNAAPWSAAPARIAQEAGARVLGGLRFTFHFSWRGRSLPVGMPIDHVLADPALQPVTVAVSEPVGSDHRAVVARLAWRKSTRPLALRGAGR